MYDALYLGLSRTKGPSPKTLRLHASVLVNERKAMDVRHDSKVKMLQASLPRGDLLRKSVRLMMLAPCIWVLIISQKSAGFDRRADLAGQ